MLTIRGICKSFEGRPVLKNVSFDFPEAAVTALRGPSGCGKTTLVNIILGLLAPDEGEVLLPASARTAAVFQEDRLIEHFSAARNVRLTAPSSVPDEQIHSALSELGLAQEGEKRVSEFSGGMRRRVAVIRAALFQRLCQRIRTACGPVFRIRHKGLEAGFRLGQRPVDLNAGPYIAVSADFFHLHGVAAEYARIIGREDQAGGAGFSPGDDNGSFDGKFPEAVRALPLEP